MSLFKEHKFTVAFAMIVISYLATFFMSYSLLKRVNRENTEQYTTLLATRVYDNINNEMTKPIHVSIAMANDLFLIDELKKESQRTQEENTRIIGDYLRLIEHNLGYVSAFVASDHSKNFYSNNRFTKQMDPDNDFHDRWYKAFVESGKKYEPAVDHNEEKQDQWAIFYNTRVEDENGRLLGSCGVGQSMEVLQKIIADCEQKYNVKISLINDQGIVQVDVDNLSIDKQMLSNMKIGSGAPKDYQVELDGNDFTITKYVESLGWYLVIRSGENFEGSTYSLLVIYFLGLLVFLLIILMGGVYLMMQNNRALRLASMHDQMTGLLNRNAYEGTIDELKLQPVENITYITIDINGLKTVNDTLGHKAGDILIIGVAECMRYCFESLGACYRVGGDEFAVIINGTSCDGHQLCQLFRDTLEQWTVQPPIVRLSASIGVAKSSDYKEVTIEKLVEYADMAMYREKEAYYQASKSAENE
ncbi:MAG: sensor domain-containing diguanylate cyclase [Bacteroidales bacterium]|nr:sensor domain-containing diguanylate cyclase [Bacteroidales bacterium]